MLSGSGLTMQANAVGRAYFSASDRQVLTPKPHLLSFERVTAPLCHRSHVKEGEDSRDL